MKSIWGILAGLMLLAAAAPAEAQHSSGAHGSGFHGGHFHGQRGFHGGHFYGGYFYGSPFWGYGWAYGYPWYGYGDLSYPSGYAYNYNDLHPYPNVPAQTDPTCGTWIWHPETHSYGWLACGAKSEVIVPMEPAQAGATPAER